LLWAWKERKGVSPGFLSADQVKNEFPGIRDDGLTGAALFSDTQILNCDRMTFAVSKKAEEMGAGIFNYVGAVDYRIEDGELKSIKLKDTLTDDEIEISPRFVVNACGPWAKEIAGQGTKSQLKQVFSKGLQLTLRSAVSEGSGIASQYAVALESEHIDPASKARRGGRSYFLVPWQGRMLAGTADIEFQGQADGFKFSASEIEDFVAELEQVTGVRELKPEIFHCFGGLRPIDEKIYQARGEAVVARDHRIAEHRNSVGEVLTNFLDVEGVKYTTFRSLAEQVLTKVTGVNVSPTRELELYGSEAYDRNALKREFSEFFEDQVSDRLLADYGSAARRLLDYAREHSQVVEGNPKITVAELDYCFIEENCRTLADLFIRRMPFLTLRKIDSTQLERIAQLVCERRGLDFERELENLNRELSRTNPDLNL